jgi:hypothetical protein
MRGIFGYLLALALVIAYITGAQSHDIYSGLRDTSVRGTGQLCCGGDPVNGDCEAIGENYVLLENGNYRFRSARYEVEVEVAYDKIVWASVPGGEVFSAHWCGVPRSKVYLAPVTKENPDPNYWTYCAFIDGGGA